MAKSKNTKRALLASVLSLMLCMAMLVGSTFAWFTDSVTSGKNKIVAGNLDVELEYASAFDETTGMPTKWDPVTSDISLFPETALWEPGHTEVAYLRVRNAGTLALKYKFAVTIDSETTGTNVAGDPLILSEHLVFGQVESADAIAKYKTRGEAQGAVGDTQGLGAYTMENEKLLPNAVEYVALVVYMPSFVSNEANYSGATIPSIDLGITLAATQTPHESDSFNDQYDKNIPYPVMGGTALSSSLKNGGTVILGDNVVYDAVTNPGIDTSGARTIISSKTSTLDLNGKTITFDSGRGDDNFAAFYLNSGRASLTVNGEGTIDATATTGAYCFHLIGSRMSNPKLTINGGTYIGSPTAVNIQYGTAYIKGGFFSCKPAGNVAEDQYRYTLNCIDGNYKKGADIIVTGGTFVNFDPSNNQAEGPGTNFVADGYTVVSETKENGDIWYTVVPDVPAVDETEAEDPFS